MEYPESNTTRPVSMSHLVFGKAFYAMREYGQDRSIENNETKPVAISHLVSNEAWYEIREHNQERSIENNETLINSDETDPVSMSQLVFDKQV